MQDKSAARFTLGWALAAGALWGTLEIFGGAILKQTGLAVISGAVLTACGGFFLILVWRLTGQAWTYPVALLVASLFRITNSLTWQLPAVHHGFGNHVYGMATEAFALTIFLILFRKRLQQPAVQSAVGAGFALLSALIFPSVSFVTGNPACIYRQTGLPVALVFAPLAMLLSALLLPAGFRLADYLRTSVLPSLADRRLQWGVSGLTLALLLLILFVHV